MSVIATPRRCARALAAALLAIGLGGALGCSTGHSWGGAAGRSAGRYDRDQLAAALADPKAEPGIVVGEFALKSPGIVDGDTIKVEGIEGSLRLLGLDAEETFKSDADRRAYDEGFAAYYAKKQAGHDAPVKVATPLGTEAKHWAEEFFEGVRTVRIERDHPKELRDRYDRLLAYVMVEKDGVWLNYNVECVRAGMSPYFTKYGYSRRFHDEFVAAQDEARFAERGIWDPKLEHYPDYEQRLRWWNARAEVVASFDEEAEGNDRWISLTSWDAMDRLAELEGEEVVVLATVGSIRPRQGKRPARVMLSRRMFSDLPLIFFDDEVLAKSGIENAKSEYVRVQGTVSRYVFSSRRTRKGKAKAKDEEPRSQLQIQIRRPEQITFVDTRPSRFAAEPAGGMTTDEPVPSDPPPAPADEPAPSEAPEAPTDASTPSDTPPAPTDAPTPSDPPAPAVPTAPRPVPSQPPALSQGSP